MLLLVPYQVDVPMRQWPISNFILIGLITLSSIFFMYDPYPGDVAPFVLHGWSPTGMLGHMFVHLGYIHLFGNMLFLWVFGNAVCAKVGNIAYPFLFLLFGVIGGAVHNLCGGLPAIGASGAINGIVAMFLFFYPQNEIRVFWFFIFMFRGNTFEVGSMWLILLWLVFDVWGALAGSGGVAYWAHIGGFAAGAAVAIVSLKLDWVQMTRTERSLVDLLAGR